MRSGVGAIWLVLTVASAAYGQSGLTERARRYLAEMTRIDTSNPPGNESRMAAWLEKVAREEAIPCEALGGDPSRLNWVARLAGSGTRRPLLLMAHTDVAPAEAAQWSVAPFAAEAHGGFLYGRGSVDDKSLLAAELAVIVELKRSGRRLRRDIILAAEADEEEGSGGIRWLAQNAWEKIDAEFAINEGGFATDLPSGIRLYRIETSEKAPTPMVLLVRGTAGHGSLPRPDNAVVRLSRAVVRLADADQPVRLSAGTRRYLKELSRLPDYAWLGPILPRLEDPDTAIPAANEIGRRDADVEAQVRATVSPNTLRAGSVVNVIPALAEALIDVRRLPNETSEEILARLRETVPSSLSTVLYRTMESVLREAAPRARVLPYMQRGATDGAFLRRKGMDVYGAPLFAMDDRQNHPHGADERISLAEFDAGVRLLWKIVTEVGK
ncbi:MAG: M20/M25/M40 family metallo-hydrolase [Acidobacteriia bacterium]|nr:M20/M25/M40 family metallo-hydrolase [Terriglobia bacterium]